jgi:hypothetical protein
VASDDESIDGDGSDVPRARSGKRPRELLAIGQRALAAGELDGAHHAFVNAALRYSGPSQLLGGGHGWRGVAQVAMLEKDWALAERMLSLAERTYVLGADHLGPEEDDDERATELRTGLLEGRATVGTLRADIAIRRLQYAEARQAIDAVYPLYRQLGDRPCVADLWVTTARLAEREGRWFSARTAWAQVLRVRKANGDEFGQCDALIRMVEAMLVEDEVDKARKKLDEAEALARYLEDERLQGRVHIAMAKILEHEHSWEAAWEKWLDADHALRSADPMLRGLSQVRMARSAVRVRPAEAGEYLQRGLIALFDAHHPDAIGIVLHQLAIVALVNGDARTALIAAVGADRIRGGDDLVQGVVLRALLQLQELEAAYTLALVRHDRRDDEDRLATLELIEARLDDPPDLRGTSTRRLREAARDAIDAVVGPLARSRGLALSELDSRRAAMKLTGGATEQGAGQRVQEAVQDVAAGTRENGERPWLVFEITPGQTERVPLRPGLSLVGRGGNNAIRMGWDGKASRTHCAIEVDGAEIRLRNLSSSGGTYVGGDAIEDDVRIDDGTPFRVGETVFHVEWQAPIATHAAIAAVQAAPAAPAGEVDPSTPPASFAEPKEGDVSTDEVLADDGDGVEGLGTGDTEETASP